ncbi:hypothetical protein [Adhaeribacter terreus]|uniref:Lipocalin-like domain-containing protein n=1 Tax=Adhaeribacter terreus TaxID=529703 RepID=A0ABW0EFM7_9BACT
MNNKFISLILFALISCNANNQSKSKREDVKANTSKIEIESAQWILGNWGIYERSKGGRLAIHCDVCPIISFKNDGKGEIIYPENNKLGKIIYPDVKKEQIKWMVDKNIITLIHTNKGANNTFSNGDYEISLTPKASFTELRLTNRNGAVYILRK